MSCFNGCTILDSYITDCRAGQLGGGLIGVNTAARLVLRNLTINRGSAGISGGGMYLQGSAEMTGVTITNSWAAVVRRTGVTERLRGRASMRHPVPIDTRPLSVFARGEVACT